MSVGAHRHLRDRRGFTIVELLVVVVVIGILASMTLPTLAGAAAPLPRPVADLMENDLRLARFEAMGAVRDTVIVVGEDRAHWWMQPAGELSVDRALPSSARALGFDTLGPYRDHRFHITVNGAELADGDAVIAQFDSEGTRNDSTVVVSLLSPLGGNPVAQWRLDPRRTRLRDIE